MKIFRRLLRFIVCAAFALALAAANYIAFAPGGILPAGTGYALYPVLDDRLDKVVKPGALVVFQRGGSPEEGNIAAYMWWGSEVIGVVTSSENNGAYFKLEYVAGESYTVPSGYYIGKAVYTVDGVGAVCHWLGGHPTAVLVFDAAVVLIGAAYLLTAPKRRRKTEIQSLIETFEFYGQKYDLEDANIDY